MLDLAVRPLGHSEKNSLNSISYQKTSNNTSKEDGRLRIIVRDSPNMK